RLDDRRAHEAGVAACRAATERRVVDDRHFGPGLSEEQGPRQPDQTASDDDDLLAHQASMIPAADAARWAIARSCTASPTLLNNVISSSEVRRSRPAARSVRSPAIRSQLHTPSSTAKARSPASAFAAEMSSTATVEAATRSAATSRRSGRYKPSRLRCAQGRPSLRPNSGSFDLVAEHTMSHAAASA